MVIIMFIFIWLSATDKYFHNYCFIPHVFVNVLVFGCLVFWVACLLGSRYHVRDFIYIYISVSKSFVLLHAISSQTNREGMEGKKGKGEMSFLLLGDPRSSDWKELKIQEVRGKRNGTLSVLKMVFPLSQEDQS